jgi:hypothetical protein
MDSYFLKRPDMVIKSIYSTRPSSTSIEVYVNNEDSKSLTANSEPESEIKQAMVNLI